MPEYRLDQLLAQVADPAAAVAAAEEGYRAKVEGVVSTLLASPRRRVILLAGPSSSGKTTTAAILADRLGQAGHSAAVVSLDDFYRDSAATDYPRTADGRPDYESVDALAVGEIHDCIETILRGGTYPLPRFDFLTGARAPESVPLSVPEGGYLIIEGLHALNPRLTAGLPDEGLFRLFISVSTNINGEGGRVLSGRRIRFLRRLSRDSLYRASDAANTYALWHLVTAGEDRYLYPFRDTADCTLDTFHLYELGVLRPFAEALLAAPGAPDDEYIGSIRRALRLFAPLPLSLVPAGSLLREFLPGEA